MDTAIVALKADRIIDLVLAFHVQVQQLGNLYNTERN